MNKNYFEIIRAGVNTTFQDQGRNNLYHIGIPFSGAMDNRNYLLANKLVGNELKPSLQTKAITRHFLLDPKTKILPNQVRSRPK